jgi:hypothetical protein
VAHDIALPTREGLTWARAEDVVVIEPNDAWAVGLVAHETDDPATTRIIETWTAHWDGSAWRHVRSPSFGDWGSELLAVDAAGPDDVWAVGVISNVDPSISKPLVLHFDGVRWSRSSIPDARGSDALNDVVVTAEDDVLVGGWHIGERQRPATFRWNGSAWSASSSPPVAPEDGQSLIESMDGSGHRTWLTTSGDAATIQLRTQDGWKEQFRAWSVRVQLESIAAEGWAVGQRIFYRHSRPTAPVIVRRGADGLWTRTPAAPTVGDTYLMDVTGGTGEAWTVGWSTARERQRALVQRWNGTEWKNLTLPDDLPRVTWLEGLDEVGGTLVAVGASRTRLGADSTPMALHREC